MVTRLNNLSGYGQIASRKAVIAACVIRHWRIPQRKSRPEAAWKAGWVVLDSSDAPAFIEGRSGQRVFVCPVRKHLFRVAVAGSGSSHIRITCRDFLDRDYHRGW
jgi:hypothetical protein